MSREWTFDGKNVHAVKLGRMGGRKGGLARAAALSPEERKAQAQKAAAARWARRRARRLEPL